jgi:hypothetical protein
MRFYSLYFLCLLVYYMPRFFCISEAFRSLLVIRKARRKSSTILMGS